MEQKRLEDENGSDPEIQDLAVSLRGVMPDPISRKVLSGSALFQEFTKAVILFTSKGVSGLNMYLAKSR